MSKKVRSVLPLLRLLAKSKDAKVRRTILQTASPNLINALSECSLNILRGRVRLSPRQKKSLYRHRQHLRQLARRGSSLATRRKLLVSSQRGGFLPLLIAPVLSLLGSAIGRAIGKRL